MFGSHKGSPTPSMHHHKNLKKLKHFDETMKRLQPTISSFTSKPSLSLRPEPQVEFNVSVMMF